MTKLDEIEQLAALKDKGILSAEEFELKKAKLLKEYRKGRSWFFVPIIFLMPILGLLMMYSYESGFDKCDSRATKKALENVLVKSPFGKMVGFEVIEISGIKEASRKNDSLVCYANVLSSAGRIFVEYKIDHIKNIIEITDASYASR